MGGAGPKGEEGREGVDGVVMLELYIYGGREGAYGEGGGLFEGRIPSSVINSGERKYSSIFTLVSL